MSQDINENKEIKTIWVFGVDTRDGETIVKSLHSSNELAKDAEQDFIDSGQTIVRYTFESDKDFVRRWTNAGYPVDRYKLIIREMPIDYNVLNYSII